MRRSAVALALALLAGPALAHGGRYVGPFDNPVDSAREWNDWPYPDTRDYGATPAPQDSWRFAWHLMQNGVVEGRRSSPGGAVPARTVAEGILPALRRAAADDHLYYGIQGGSLLGLVRTGDGEALSLLRRAATASGDSAPHRVIVESAVLGLGIGRAGDARLLRSIAADAKARPRTRAFSLFALALLERGAPSPETLDLLDAALRMGPDDSWQWHDLPAVAAFSLGRMESPKAAALLDRFLRAERGAADVHDRDLVVRCQAAASLGRLGGPEALATLGIVLARDGNLPAQGAAIGLGLLGGAGDEATALACTERLVGLLEAPGTNPMVLRFATVSLGRIAARPPSPARAVALARVHRSLASGWPNPSWAALAAGVAGKGCSFEERTALAAAVRKLWEAAPATVAGQTGKERGLRVEERGGCLVALGLLGHVPARPLLERVFLDEAELDTMRGYAAEGLGLLGDLASAPHLRKALGPRSHRGLHRPVALAVGLLGDAESLPLLLDRVRDPKSSASTLSACAQALGLLRDGTAVKPLLEVLEDPRFPDPPRAFAAHALARMAAGNRPDPFAGLSEDVPFRACSDSLVEIWSLF